MRDDFAALDLFTASGKATGKKKKSLLALPRRRVQGATAKRPLTAAFLPLIAKMKKKPANFTLQGWPVPISWSAPRPNEREDFSKYF